MIKEVVLVGVGGFVGSVLRYGTSLLMANCVMFSLPLGTFTVNAVGSFTIGLFLSLFSSGSWYYLLVVGLCGGFTTFSTFSAESLAMLKSSNYLNAGIYIGASVLVCIFAVMVGFYVGKRINII